MDWNLVYDLKQDADYIAGVQRATLTTDTGLAAEPALFGSQEWWGAIETRDLPVHVVDGIISKVYWGSMADWAEFQIEEHGRITSWTRRGDVTRYVEGRRTKISFVLSRRSPMRI